MKFFNGIWTVLTAPFKLDFWVAPFPDCYDPECFNCRKGDCDGCAYKPNTCKCGKTISSLHVYCDDCAPDF